MIKQLIDYLFHRAQAHFYGFYEGDPSDAQRGFVKVGPDDKAGLWGWIRW